MARFTVYVLVLLIFSLASHAQEGDGGGDQVDIFDRTFGIGSLTPPTNLAASALSVGSDSINKITSSDALITTLGNGIDANGRFKWTGALEVSPYALGASIDSEAYRTDPLQRVVANSRLSLAFSEGESENSDGSIAFGVQTVLFDRGDTFLRPYSTDGDYYSQYGAATTAAQACANNAVRTEQVRNRGLGAAPPPPTDGTVESDSDSDLAPLYANCIREIRRSTWNDASLGIGVVTVARADENQIDDISQSNTVAYVTASYGFEGLDSSDRFRFGPVTQGSEPQLYSNCGNGFELSCNAQLVFQAKYQTDGVYEIPDLGERTGESFGWGGKFVAGSAKSSGYAFYRQENVDVDGTDFDVLEYGIGFEARVFGDQWLNISVSRLDNDLVEEDETVAKASISFSFNDAARFVNPFAGG